jgi:hypothetical protein
MVMHGFDRASRPSAQSVFELGDDLLDGVEVRRIGRQEEQFCANTADRLANSLSFVATQIVQYHDITGPERRQQECPDISKEPGAVDRSVKNARGLDPVAAERGEECQRAPVSMRSLADQPLAARAPASQRRHVGRGPGLVNENQPARVYPPLMGLPSGPAPGQIGPVLLSGDGGFF